MEEVLSKCLNGRYILDDNVHVKKELKIVSDNLNKSTLTIICKKNICCPEFSQYEIHDDIILKFDMDFSMFIHPDFDIYHYSVRDYKACGNIHKLRKADFERIFKEDIINNILENIKE